MKDNSNFVFDLCDCTLDESMAYSESWIQGMSNIATVMAPPIEKIMAKATNQAQSTGTPMPNLASPATLTKITGIIETGKNKLKEQRNTVKTLKNN